MRSENNQAHVGVQRLLEKFYPETRFGGFSAVDSTIAFYARVNALVGEETTVLDVGCGRGAAYHDDPVVFRRELRTLRRKCRRVLGIDVDVAGTDNPAIDEFRLIRGATWPVEDGSIDLVLADFVLEHVSDPDAFFSECRRVLKGGGVLCLRTTNRLGYVGLIARLVPNRYHHRILRVVQSDRKQEDVFATMYRANTVARIRRALAEYGFMHAVYTHEPEPGYLSFSALVYYMGTVLQRITPAYFRTTIFAFARKLDRMHDADR